MSKQVANDVPFQLLYLLHCSSFEVFLKPSDASSHVAPSDTDGSLTLLPNAADATHVRPANGPFYSDCESISLPLPWGSLLMLTDSAHDFNLTMFSK